MKNTINNIYLIGLGALGGMYAASFYDMDPQSVKIIADKRRSEAIQQSGLVVNGKPYEFDFITPNDSELPKADLIIIAVKYLQLADAIGSIRNFIGDDTIVMSLLNGISSEEEIGREIGIKHLLYAYAVGMDAVRKGNVISYANRGKIVFGELDGETSARLIAVQQLFERAKIPHQMPADMQRALWSKFMMNTGINQASAVLKAPYGAFQKNEHARTLMLMAASEVLELSQKMDINLGQTDVDNFLVILDGLNPHGKTSMLQDIEAGRKSEVDLFAGTVIRLGQQHGLATPVNETLYRIIRAMEG